LNLLADIGIALSARTINCRRAITLIKRLLVTCDPPVSLLADIGVALSAQTINRPVSLLAEIGVALNARTINRRRAITPVKLVLVTCNRPVSLLAVIGVALSARTIKRRRTMTPVKPVLVTCNRPVSLLARIGVALSTRRAICCNVAFMWRFGRSSCSLSSLVTALLFWRWSMATSTNCRSASSGSSCCSAPVRRVPGVCCRPSSLLGSWFSAWGSSGGLWGGSGRCTSAVIDFTPLPVPSGGVTGSGCTGSLALDSVESELYLLPASSYNGGLSAMSGVSSTRYVSVNDLSRS
jgi:hypothetical protein